MTELAATAQDFEAAWWGDCSNTFGEEAKQITYAHRMGLVNEPRDGRWPVYDLNDLCVLDIGGGPTSLLLKCLNLHRPLVLDPCLYPEWVYDRYHAAGIGYDVKPAEGWNADGDYDEAWCYNVLQHTIDPHEVIATAKRNARALRIFEWLETEPCEGHPHTLHADELNEWIGGVGTVEHVNENGAVGLAYYGVFPL